MSVQLAGNERGKRGWSLAVAVLAATFAVGGLWWVTLGQMWLEVRETRNRLLHEADHAATLAACRELMNELPGEHLGSDDPRLPAELAALEPTYVTIEKDQVQIECGGGFHHQGFLAFAENRPPGPATDEAGSEELVEGLWFYEDTE